MPVDLTRPIYFCVPGSLHQCTGGYMYDRKIIDGLRTRGWKVEVHELAGTFPQADLETCKQAEATFARFPYNALVIVDGLAAAGLASVLAKVHMNLRLMILVHHPLAAETGLSPSVQDMLFAAEKKVLALAQRVVVTSAFTARELQQYDVHSETISVVIPGVTHVNFTHQIQKSVYSSTSCYLLCVAAFIPRKGHHILLNALARLCEKPWHLHLLGSTSRDPQTYEQVCQQIDHLELKERVKVESECDEAVLAEAYTRADVFVLPSYYEGYGMVLREACAYGLPIIACAGGAVRDTITSAGAKSAILVEPGDTQGLANALALFMNDKSLRIQMKHEAILLSKQTRSWADAAVEFEQVIARLHKSTLMVQDLTKSS